MRPRSATDWRGWWSERGERELRTMLAGDWTPLAGADDVTVAVFANRFALLLGSRSPHFALVAELGRMRAEAGAAPDAAEDDAFAARVAAWFPAKIVGSR